MERNGGVEEIPTDCTCTVGRKNTQAYVCHTLHSASLEGVSLDLHVCFCSIFRLAERLRRWVRLVCGARDEVEARETGSGVWRVTAPWKYR